MNLHPSQKHTQSTPHSVKKRQFVNNHFSKAYALAVLAAASAMTNLAQAANELWVGVPNSTVTTNWSDIANWSPAASPSAGTIYFGNNGQTLVGTVDNVVDTNITCSSINFTNFSTTHTTLVLPGQTLTISGSLGATALNENPAGQAAIVNTITGVNGTLAITGTSAGGMFVASTNSSASGIAPTLDMSGLGTFVMSNVNAAAAIEIGDGAARSCGILNLAKTNYIALSTNGTLGASALVVGCNTGNNGGSPGGTLNLGQTNTILVDNIGVGLSKLNSSTIRFNPALTGANPSVYIGGFSGSAVKHWIIGDGLATGGSSVTGSGTCNFNGGTINAVVSALVLGHPSTASTASPSSSGTLSFSAGTISVTTLSNAVTTAVVSGASPTATGTINVTGTASLQAATAVMAVVLSAGGTSTGTINVTNGTLSVGTLIAGSGTSIININGGTFIVTNTVGTVGTPAYPLSALNLTGANLHLNVDASATVANIAASSVGTSGTSTINIDSIANYPGGTTTIELISYTGNDPYGNLALGTIPSSYSNPILVDDTANSSIDLTITSSSVVTGPGDITWNGGSATGNNWSDAANWNGTSIVAGDTLFFDGTTRLSPVNDTTAGTTYSNITFNATAGAFVLNGNPINFALGAAIITNLSSAPQTVNLGLSYNGNITLAGGDSSAPLIIGGIITNTAIDGYTNTIALMGTGILTNLLANTMTTNSLLLTNAANWTIVNNPSSIAIDVTNYGLNIVKGSTLNFGNAGSAPVFASTNGSGQGFDNNVGDSGTASTLNVANGALTLGRRLDTANGNINISGGTLNVWSQIQMANVASGNVSSLDVTGGTLDVLNTAGTSPAGGIIYVASRGTGTFTVSGANTLAECTTLDISRNAVSGSVGTVSLNGGTLKVGTKISTATLNSVAITSPIPSATFYFNGGTLQPNNSSVTFQGSTGSTAIPIMAYVQAGGAIINTPASKNLWFGETLMHDPSLGSTDGGLTKLGVGILTLASNATYTGNTTISAGTLALTNTATMANTPNIFIGSGATFDVSGLISPSTPFTFGGGQTLVGTNGTIVGDLSLASGSLALSYTAGTPALTVTTSGAQATISSATLTLNNNAVTISVSGSALGAGNYLLVSAGPGGSVAGSVASSTLTVTGAGATAPASLQIIGNQLYLVVGYPLTANPYTVTRAAGVSSLKIALTDLAANWSDPNGGTLSLVSVNNSANGATVTTNGGFVLYSNPTNDLNDTFSYVIEDSYGLTATGVVNISVSSTGVFGQTTPSISATGGAPTMGFAGIPGYSYSVQRSTDLVNWTTIWTTNAPPAGLFQFTDNAAKDPAAYYRLQWNP